MAEHGEIVDQRRKAAQALRDHKGELISRWMEKIHLLTREKGAEGFATERVLREDAEDLMAMVLSRLETRTPETDSAAFYHLILEGRQNNVRLADVAYVLLELKSVSKQVIFETLEDELEAFRVSRLVDDTVEAVLRKSADLYELTAEADHLTARERLQEIFAAWDAEEALADAQSPAEVLQVAAGKLRGIWDLAGCRIRFGEEPGGARRDITEEPPMPLPLLTERRQYLTDREVAGGGTLSLLERVGRRREAYVCPDVSEDELLVNAAELAEAGALSLACCPLVSRGEVMGALLLYGRARNTFRETDQRRLADFANVMALALDRTGRIERSRKEISEAEVIARIGRVLLELPTREALLEGVAEALRAFRDYFDVSLFRVDAAAGECALVAEAGRGGRYRPDQYRQKIGEGFIGLCARTGETVRASELEQDDRRLVAFEEEYRARSELALPVKKGERVIGVLHFLSEREGDFPDSEIAALEHVAPHIGVALQNASMITQRRRDQYHIEQAQRQLTNIIRSTAVGITSTDKDGVYTHWMPSCEKLLGYSQSEVVGRKTPADLAAEPYDLKASLARCLREGRAESEVTMLRKDGVPRVIQETRVPMQDEEGRHIGFTAYLMDVTERKRAEEQVRRERDALQLVVGAMGAGLALFDHKLGLQWANTTLMQWFDFAEDALGKECHEVCVCGYCKRETCPIEVAIKTGRPQSRVHETTDRKGVWHCYQQVFTPVSHGETRLVVLTLDITDQRRQTEQMRLINKLTEKVETSLDLEKVLHLVLTCVTAGHAIGLNRAFIFLLDESAAQLEGRMAVGPVSLQEARRIWQDLDESAESIEQLLDSAAPSEGDMELTRRVRDLRIPVSHSRDTLVSTLGSRTSAHVGDARSDPHMDERLAGRLELAEFVCVPLAVQDEPLGVMLADNKYSRSPVTQDQVQLLEMFSRQASLAIANARAYQRIGDQLRELRRTRDRLIEAERMASVGRMASHLAHEIRNPLTVIGGFAASIARQYKHDPKTYRNASIIHDEVQRLERTLVNVLDYTRPLRPDKTPICLNEIVGETIEQFREQLDEEGISVRASLERDLPPVPADGEMIKQVVINLLKNAIEGMENKGGGTLSVSTALAEGEVSMAVADTGPGMEPDTLEKLFSPFFTTKIGGVGLGLSVSRRIVEQHGGRIEVESELGAGSTFRVTLALSDKGPAPLRRQQASSMEGG
ncbi:MAG: hypothetical protein AMK73_05315 [Planctomycetes bacterium SM23_32]|nr:MAG: hypothetical protein AMK73_05315 [Planctomycetes bacterium SM23_32]